MKKTRSESRNLAARIVHEVTEKEAYTNLALAKFLSESSLSREDKRLVTEMVNGTVRMLKHLDWVLNLFLSQNIDKQHPWIRTVLRISVYQILFMQKIPEYAIVNDAVELAQQKTNQALARVVNGVLRNILRNRDKIEYPVSNTVDYLSIYYSHPEWMVRKWLLEMDREECEKILIYNNSRPKVYLRTNVLKITRDKLIDMLEKEGIFCSSVFLTPWDIEVDDMQVSLEDTDLFQKGYFYIQNPASMLAAPILNPQPGETIYDLCCGVGGKSTHMAELMENKGKIKAFDLYPRKLKLLEENCHRLGIDIVEGEAADITLFSDMPKGNRVLLDAPCSGLGVLNRRSDLRWKKKEENIADLVSLQLKLLQKAAELVEEGGILLYSTCTINKSENEEVVTTFLKKRGDFILTSFAEKISFFLLDEKDRRAAESGMLTILPGKYRTDGMFYALMRRKKRDRDG